MRSCLALLSAVSVAVGSLACGLTADFSGLQGGTLGDAGADASLDAAVEAGSGADVQGTTDAQGASDGGGSYCSKLTTAVRLCTDFDEGKSVDTGWGATDVYGGEAIRVDTVAFSPPGSFLSAINPSGAPASARLLKALPTQTTHVHIGFEMLLVPSDGNFELAKVHQVTSDGTTYGLSYNEVASALQVELKTLRGDGTTFDQTWPIGPPPTDWTRVEIDMEIGDPGSFTVTQNGNTVVGQASEPTSTPSRTALFVEVGYYSFAPASGQVHFDDVIVDWP
ncbi:MAG TPA: hypothetical protein VIF09_22100 [Polyangiaceae bacterium]